MYIQSSSAPDAVKRCDKSPGGGTEWSGAERRDGVTKRTRHLGNREGRKNRKHNAAARDRARQRGRERERETERDGCLVVSEECLHSALSVVSH